MGKKEESFIDEMIDEIMASGRQHGVMILPTKAADHYDGWMRKMVPNGMPEGSAKNAFMLALCGMVASNLIAVYKASDLLHVPAIHDEGSSNQDKVDWYSKHRKDPRPVAIMFLEDRGMGDRVGNETLCYVLHILEARHIAARLSGGDLGQAHWQQFLSHAHSQHPADPALFNAMEAFMRLHNPVLGTDHEWTVNSSAASEACSCLRRMKRAEGTSLIERLKGALRDEDADDICRMLPGVDIDILDSMDIIGLRERARHIRDKLDGNGCGEDLAPTLASFLISIVAIAAPTIGSDNGVRNRIANVLDVSALPWRHTGRVLLPNEAAEIASGCSSLQTLAWT